MNRILKILVLILIPTTLWGQLTPVTDHYILNPLSINPAYAGGRGALNVASFFRRQWVGIPGSPQTMTLAVDAPVLSSKLGLGLMIVSDKMGVSKETQIATTYAYRIHMKKGGFLSFGLGAGLLTTNTAWSDLIVLDPEADYYLIDTRMFAVPDFSFGTYYTSGDFFLGFSIPRLLSYRFDFDKNKYSLVQAGRLFLYAEYRLPCYSIRKSEDVALRLAHTVSRKQVDVRYKCPFQSL
jgi:type IX secretion system PorP/SprF family membrane protein